jgi:hypothetical protein
LGDRDEGVATPSYAVRRGTLERFPHVGVLLAAAADQEAHEWSRIESGVFTHEVVSAPAGAADVNADRRIEYSEVEAFVAAANRSVSNPRAVPRVLARAPSSDRHAVLMDLGATRNAALIVGSARGLGRFSVELPNGQSWIEANLTGEGPLSLLVPGERAFLRSARGEAELVMDRRGRMELSKADFRKPEAAARGSIEAALASELFLTPFGATYYRGYVDSAGMPSVTFGAPLTEDDKRDRSSGTRRKLTPWALVGVSAASAAGAVIAGVLASSAASDYHSTDLQRPAEDARDRCNQRRTVGIVLGTVSVGAAVGAWWTWPRKGTEPKAQ